MLEGIWSFLKQAQFVLLFFSVLCYRWMNKAEVFNLPIEKLHKSWTYLLVASSTIVKIKFAAFPESENFNGSMKKTTEPPCYR